MTTPGALWREARNPPHQPVGLSFQNKAVLVTGANSGLGYAAAVKYAALGASPLILAVRSKEKGEATKASIKREVKDCGEIIDIEFDLSTLASVRAFVDRLNDRVPKLDVALLCAGIALPDYQTSPDGYEMTTQVNVLSNTLLAILLLPKLRAAAAAAASTSSSPSSPDDISLPHICFLNSLASHVVEPEWLPTDQTLIGYLNDRSKFDTTKQYYMAKLAAWFGIQGMIEHQDTQNIVINACCPGMCRTNMQRDFPFMHRLMMKVSLVALGRSAEEGSRSLVSATGLGPESNGKFWRNDEFLPPGEVLDSDRGHELYRETWDEIMKILKPHLI